MSHAHARAAVCPFVARQKKRAHGRRPGESAHAASKRHRLARRGGGLKAATGTTCSATEPRRPIRTGRSPGPAARDTDIGAADSTTRVGPSTNSFATARWRIGPLAPGRARVPSGPTGIGQRVPHPDREPGGPDSSPRSNPARQAEGRSTRSTAPSPWPDSDRSAAAFGRSWPDRSRA